MLVLNSLGSIKYQIKENKNTNHRLAMPPRTTPTVAPATNNNIRQHAQPLSPKTRPLISLQSLYSSNSIALFDPLRIHNEDHASTAYVTEEGSSICDWLRGRSVLVTGASGFVGKILVEKLLRACEGLDSVYVIVREKKGKRMQERVEEIYDDVIFNKLLRQQPKFKSKIIGINGDISLPNLGISIEDRKTIMEHVSIVYHVAATVNFDEKLKAAVDINVKGSAEMLKLARDCKGLASYVHVSSTYANCTRNAVGEQVYDPPMSPNELVTLVEQVDADVLEKAKIKILGNFPNTYSFTKCVGEKIVEEQSKGMPVCIFRPAIVISTYREPLRGWTDNMYGPTGVFTGVGLGVIRTLHCDPDKVADMVPVDMVVNCMIAASYHNWKEKNDSVRVYNYVSSTQKPIRWSEICAFIQYYGLETPTVKAMWYFCFTLNKHWIMHWLSLLFLHWLPALLADAACVCVGKPPKLMKLYKKIHKFMYVISYFTVKEWLFTNGNVQNLWNKLSEADRNAFPFNMEHLDWEEHSQCHALGLRTYLLREDLNTLPQAKKKWKRLYYLHKVVQITTGLVLLKASCSVFSFIYNLF